ncbi:MAG: hypothetical protein KDK28_08670, partial [Maritimibacter sp.]|nr:hypothetical protein [Maritimibacter sp.]
PARASVLASALASVLVQSRTSETGKPENRKTGFPDSWNLVFQQRIHALRWTLKPRRRRP